MDIISKAVAKFAFVMLAKKIAKIAFLVFLVSAVIYLIWEPVTGYMVQKDVGPSRQILGCDPAQDPCCYEPYNISNASWENPLHFTDVVCAPSGGYGTETCIGAFAVLMLIIAVAAMLAGRFIK
ncbi:hypothetical protein H0O00_05095 [Candidatus Micrarchaeota archaeon]|nr:hypothetical protein [Candidatus Micrarchaeota archaeon]